MARSVKPWVNKLALSRVGSAQGALRGAFWIWGCLGFAATALSSVSLFIQTSVGVGSSSYVTAIATLWIGGMLFFGLGAMLCTDFETTGAVPTYAAKAPPQARGFDAVYAEIPFRLRSDGTVQAEIEDKLYDFASWKEFVDYTRS